VANCRTNVNKIKSSPTRRYSTSA